MFTPQHLSKIGLHNNSTDDYGSDINFLMLMALRKVAYMPFAYMVDEVLQYLKYFIYNRNVSIETVCIFLFNVASGDGACSTRVLRT